MNEETTASGNVAEAENAAPELTEGIAADTGAPPVLDEYQQRVEQLLDHHEKKQENDRKNSELAQEEQDKQYEAATLQEGESWDSVYN